MREREAGRRGLKKEEEETKDDARLSTVTVPALTPDRSPSPPSSMSMPATPKDFPRSLPGPYTQSPLTQDSYDYGKTARAPPASDADEYVMKTLPETMIKNEDNDMTRDVYMHHDRAHMTHPNEQLDIAISISIPNNHKTPAPATALCQLNFPHAPQETYIQTSPGPASNIPIDDEFYCYYNQLSGVPFLSHWEAQAQALLDSQVHDMALALECNSMINVNENTQESSTYIKAPSLLSASASASASTCPTSTSTHTSAYTQQMHPLTFDRTTYAWPSYTFYSGCTGTTNNYNNLGKSDFDLYLAAFSLPEDVGRAMLDASAGLNTELGLFQEA
ncbi:hypothetical protein BD410DRAFT_261471 [Rickenella mellea]|uniref:Uncharacterized protein n=1 Tax=Rickenella mellea TaxID=50990 RepID=A0A4Y7Q6I0_9AGAM|nr:hypothetical protein BD410DRAFT_261471 [Rickenella mellea]